MNKFFSRLVALLMLLSVATGARAIGWPANYEGVMLQGFYWDSYSDSKWTNLESKADEYSKYFKLIWIPNSGNCGGGNNMGYMPQYWFTNHNSSFGTEAQLRSMIATYKAKGTGFIADVVINHRVGKSNWTDFPVEQWNGQTWKIGPEGICCTDEVKDAAGQAKPTGAPDTGEDFNGARDLDHTNANVQNNCKNYCKFLLEDLGYAGFRYDMVKGYAGQYTKIYNQYSRPTYSVGEYWDGSYDAVKDWIEATGKESAAFDFPFKYAVNKAFSSGDMTQLVWKANGTTDQPAGMIHFGYAQLAVTFIDNHDTYRDGNKFNGNVLAANAFMLCSPGTPCVFLPHYKQYASQIQKMIEVRNKVGVSNTSAVKVLKSTRDCYMAEVTGSKGKLVVKVGSSMDSPSGYTSSQIYTSGDGYCIWSTAEGGGGGGGGDDPDPGTNLPEINGIYLKNTSGWNTPQVWAWTTTANCTASGTWPGDLMTKVNDTYWKWEVPAGKSEPENIILSNDGDNTKTPNLTYVKSGIYDNKGTLLGTAGGDGPIIPGKYPAHLYIVGHINNAAWAPHLGVEGTHNGEGLYEFKVTVDDANEGKNTGFFSFLTKLGTDGSDWNTANSGDRYGAASADEMLQVGTKAPIKLYPVNVSASSAYSWQAPADQYTVYADLKNMTVHISKNASGIDIVGADLLAAPVYYNLMGVEVKNPTPGIYLVRRGNTVTKELVR